MWCSQLTSSILALGLQSETLFRQELMQLSLYECSEGDRKQMPIWSLYMGKETLLYT